MVNLFFSIDEINELKKKVSFSQKHLTEIDKQIQQSKEHEIKMQDPWLCKSCMREKLDEIGDLCCHNCDLVLSM